MFNPVYTLEGDTMVESRGIETEKDGQRSSRTWISLSGPSSLPPSCSFSPNLPSLPSALHALLHYCCHYSAMESHSRGVPYFPSSVHALPLKVRRYTQSISICRVGEVRAGTQGPLRIVKLQSQDISCVCECASVTVKGQSAGSDCSVFL